MKYSKDGGSVMIGARNVVAISVLCSQGQFG